MNTSKQVIVIGGGPAGAVVAMELARNNFDVMVLEASHTPRQKPGECLPPILTPLLRKLRLEQVLNKHSANHSNQAVWGSDSITEEHFINGVHGAGIHIDRRLFERDLAREAELAGVDWRTGHVLKGLVKKDLEWQLQVSHGKEQTSFVADFLVDATGRKSTVARYLNIKRHSLDKLVGISAIFAGDTGATPSTLIEACADGWWYSARLPTNELVVAFMTDSDAIPALQANKGHGFKRLLQKTHHTKERLEYNNKEPVIDFSSVPLSVHAASASRLEQITGEGWLAVGDAACTYDPLSSYGITAAIGTAYYGSCAIKDYLRGRKDSFSTYHYLMDKMYSAYLPLVESAYQQEERWKEHSFWKRRLE